MLGSLLPLLLLCTLISTNAIGLAQKSTIFAHRLLGNPSTTNIKMELQQLLAQRFATDAENMFLSQLGILREDYYDRFIEYAASQPDNLERCRRRQAKVLRDCRASMGDLVPSNAPAHWSIEESVQGLDNDMSQFIEEQLFTTFDKDHKKRLGLKGLSAYVTSQRIRWVASQSLLLLLNMAQNEWRQYLARRAVDRRLAEVPEFPLL